MMAIKNISQFERKFKRMTKAQDTVNLMSRELTGIIEAHLGEGWFVTYAQSDGFVLASPDASNYLLGSLFKTLRMDRESAIESIESEQFN